MTDHNHITNVDGCYRCELTNDEIRQQPTDHAPRTPTRREVPGEVPWQAAAALTAVLRGAHTVRAVMTACDLRSTSTALLWLTKAKQAGLVTWDRHDDDRVMQATIRPTIRIVAHTPQPRNRT
jgi:hypothetical protein